MGRQLPLLPSGARTANGSGSTFRAAPDSRALRVTLQATAKTGTSPTLDAVIQDSVDGGTVWNTVGTFTQLTDVGSQTIDIIRQVDASTPDTYGPLIRAAWTIGGQATPGYTFAISAWELVPD